MSVKLPLKDLNPNVYSSHSISIYICEVTITRKEPKCRASRAGGGDSSNQTSSSSTFLAKRASEWAIVFALRFTKLTEKLLKPVARH